MAPSPSTSSDEENIDESIKDRKVGAADPLPSEETSKQVRMPSASELAEVKLGWIERIGKSWAPAFRIIILGLICCIAIGTRVFSVIRYESVIHEFDPWFNFRNTKILNEQGYYAFRYFIDRESWYPLGRYTGGTLFPGLMLTANFLHKFAHNVLLLPLDIREVCVFTAPLFSAFTAIATYLLTIEISGRSESGLIAALFISIVPSYISRSVAGSYDNEAVAIFALVFSFYRFLKVVNTGSMLDGLIAAFAYYYMVLTWGGYVFVLGIISIYVVGLIILGQFNQKVYIGYSIVYIVGNLLSLITPFVSIWAVWESSEHIPSHLAFIFMQGYALNTFVKRNLSRQKFEFLQTVFVKAGVLAVVALFIYLLVMGKYTIGHRIMTLVNPVYAKKHHPLTASISEHQPTSWSSFFFDIQFMLIFAPIGTYVCLKKTGNAKLFMALYSVLSLYFASVMVRLMLVAAPACCVMSGIGVSHVFRVIMSGVRESIYDALGGRGKPAKAKKRLPVEFGVIGLALLGYFVCVAIFHGTWSGAEAYSHPSIIMSYKDRAGNKHIIDDYREGYYWLRKNTDQEAKVLSWWDYGYHLSGIANRTTIIDNNTWNKTHIGRVGMALASREDEAHQIMESMDVDYVMVVFGGVSGYSGDDINKFMWMVRIAGSENPHIMETDYLGERGYYRVDEGASKTMLNCLMYKLSYYRFGEVDNGRGLGFDVQRKTKIGAPSFNLDYFEEAFTSKHWIVRIYRRKKKNNRSDIKFDAVDKKRGVQELSGIASSGGSGGTYRHKYAAKLRF